MKAYQLSKFVIWLCRMYLYYTTIFVICIKLFTYNLLHLKICCHPSPIYIVLPNQNNFESHYTHTLHQAAVKIMKLSSISNQCWIFISYHTPRMSVDADKVSF